MEITRHFEASTYIVHQNTVLLQHHLKLKFWVPVGGHLERDELPQDGAVREAKEESGLDVVLYNPDMPLGLTQTTQLIRPMHMNLHHINEFHQHISFVFFGTCEVAELSPREGESKELKWVSQDEIDLLDAPDNVKVYAKHALKILDSEHK